MISGIAVVQDVLKALFETELGVKISEISLEDRLLVFRHTINLGSVFLANMDLENMITLVFFGIYF